MSDGTILMSMTGVTALGMVTKFGEGDTPKPRVLIAGVIATTALLIVNSRAPKVATGLALISLLTAASLALTSSDPNPFERVNNFITGKDSDR